MSNEIIDKLIKCGVLEVDHDCGQSEICESTTDLADNILEEEDDDPTTYLLDKDKLPSCISWNLTPHAYDILIWEDSDDAEEYAVKYLADRLEDEPEVYDTASMALENGFTQFSEDSVRENLIESEVTYWQNEGEDFIREELEHISDDYRYITEDLEEATERYEEQKEIYDHYSPMIEICTLSPEFENYLVDHNIDCDLSIRSLGHLKKIDSDEEKVLTNAREVVDIYKTMKILSRFTQGSYNKYDNKLEHLLVSDDPEAVAQAHSLIDQLEEYDSENLYRNMTMYSIGGNSWKDIFDEGAIYENIAYILYNLGKPLHVDDLSTMTPKKVIDVDYYGDFDHSLMIQVILGIDTLDIVSSENVISQIKNDKKIDSYSTYDLGLQILKHLGDYHLWKANAHKFGSTLTDCLELSCAVLNYFCNEADDNLISDEEMEDLESNFETVTEEYEDFDIYDYDLWYGVMEERYKDEDMYRYYKDYGYDAQMIIDIFGGVDFKGLAEYIVRMDGVGRTIGFYDGELHECDDLYYVIR